MRSDMKRKLVDTYRVRSGEKNADVKKDRRNSRRLASRLTDDNELEEDFRRTSGMRMKGWDRKAFGENLAPLYRFLWSCRGKHWDKVYSQISEHCDKDSAVGRHIYEHLWIAVAKDVRMVDGKPHTFSVWLDGLYPVTSNGRPGGYKNLYIHPKTGVLLEAPKEEKKSKFVDENFRQLGELRFAVRTEGVWYLIEIARQKYEHEVRTTHTENGIVEKEVSVPKFWSVPCAKDTLDCLPTHIRRRLNVWKHWCRASRRYQSRQPDLYVKVAKTMSKKEKKTYLL